MQKTDKSKRKFRLLAPVLKKSRDFKTAEDGATAVEFSLVAFPFFVLVMAIFETCLSFFAAQALETAVDQPARKIRTGQINLASHPSAADLKPVICAGGLSLFTCNDIKLDIQVLPAFAAPTTPFDGSGNLDTSGMGYAIGASGDIMMIRAYYEWPVIFDYLQSGANNMSNGKRLLVATSAFRIE